MSQRITHSECIYAPGDGDLVKELFIALGFAVTKVDPHPYIIAHVDPDVMDVMSNVIYASELTEMQKQFEKTLQATLASSAGIPRSHRQLGEGLPRRPAALGPFRLRVRLPGQFPGDHRSPARSERAGQASRRSPSGHRRVFPG